VGERSTRWLSTRWAGLISDQWCVPTRTNRDHRSLSHGHTPTVRPCQTSSNGGGRALLGANVSPADVSFRPGISVSPKQNGGAPKSNPTKLSAAPAVRANTRSRVRRLFAAKQGHYLYHRAASSPLIPSRGLLLRRRFCGLCRLHLPLGSLLFSAHRVFLRLCGGHLHENDPALDDRFFIRVHRRFWEALYPSSLSTSYPLGTWSRLCTIGTPFVVGDHSGGLCCGSPRRL
jgi:hypothetical protein